MDGHLTSFSFSLFDARPQIFLPSQLCVFLVLGHLLLELVHSEQIHPLSPSLQFSLSQALCYVWGRNPRELRCQGGRGGKTQTDLLVSALPNWEEEYVFTRKLSLCKLAVDVCWHPQKWSPYPPLSRSFGAVFFLTLG